MKELEFIIALKSGATPEGLALIKAYDKCFTGHTFTWSTGIHAARKGFNPARPGKALKSLLSVAETAVKSLAQDGQPVNNTSLKARIELIQKRFDWADSTRKDLSVWDGSAVQRFTVPDGVNPSELEDKLNQELQKARPDFALLIEGVISKGSNSLFGFWQKVIEGRIKAKNGKPLKPNTIKAKRQTMEILKRYQEDRNVTLTFESMDMPFYQDFMQWMETEGKEGKDGDGKPCRESYDINSRGKNIKDIKSILNLARINGYINHDKFSGWPIPKEKNEVVTITKDELLQINALELSGVLDDVRDTFILACLLGPRISDYKAFNPESLSTQAGVTFFTYTQEKTGATCKIPVHPIAQAIIDKRGGFPPMISEQNFRYRIKDVCKLAELNDRVILKVRNNKPVYAIKWKAISPHAARRAFASGLFYGWFLNRPMPAAYCMTFTGHSSEKSFLLYIDARAKEVNEKALEYFDLTPQMQVS